MQSKVMNSSWKKNRNVHTDRGKKSLQIYVLFVSYKISAYARKLIIVYFYKLHIRWPTITYLQIGTESSVGKTDSHLTDIFYILEFLFITQPKHRKLNIKLK